MHSWMALLLAGMLIGPYQGFAVALAGTPFVPTQTQDTVPAPARPTRRSRLPRRLLERRLHDLRSSRRAM